MTPPSPIQPIWLALLKVEIYLNGREKNQQKFEV
jgi:hypothetical protein